MHNFIDVHSHIHDKAFDEDREALVTEMKGKGFATITIGTDLVESRKAVLASEKYDNVWAAVGMHPVDNRVEVFDREAYKALLMHPKVVALGECGLDYFHIKEFEGNLPAMPAHAGQAGKDEEIDRQQRLFMEQIELAVECNKPLMLHGRPDEGMDAYEDMLHILKMAKDKHGNKLRGNAHFFVGNIDIAKQFNDLNFTVSFSGVITFAKMYEELVRTIPLDMMHAETDSPYATPVPHRGKRNTPLYVEHIYEKIAEIKGIEKEEVRLRLVKNAQRMFGLTN
jgi:TatD DNase family protein